MDPLRLNLSGFTGTRDELDCRSWASRRERLFRSGCWWSPPAVELTVSEHCSRWGSHAASPPAAGTRVLLTLPA